MERNTKSRQTSMAATTSTPTSPSQATSIPSAADGAELTPQSSMTSPNPAAKDGKPKSITPAPADDGEREGGEEVEELSEMMCSLVTNNYGETRYIGKSQRCPVRGLYISLPADTGQARLQASPSSRPGVSRGSTPRPGTLLFNAQYQMSRSMTTSGLTGNPRFSAISSKDQCSGHCLPRMRHSHCCKTSLRTSTAYSHSFTSQPSCTWSSGSTLQTLTMALVGGQVSMLFLQFLIDYV